MARPQGVVCLMIAQNGLTAAVLKEIELALKSHELIKVRVFDADREQRDAWLAETCETLGAAPVQRIGNILVLMMPQISALVADSGTIAGRDCCPFTTMPGFVPAPGAPGRDSGSG